MDNAIASVDVGKAGLLSAEARVQAALLEIGCCDLRAPISGLSRFPPDKACDVVMDSTLPIKASMESIVGNTEGVRSALGLAGFNILNSLNFPNSAMMFVGLEPWEERKSPVLHAKALVAGWNKKFAFIPGCVPLMVANGSGAASRSTLGTGVVYGMTIATVVGLFIIPVCYVFVQRLVERGGKKKPAEAAPVVVAEPETGGAHL